MLDNLNPGSPRDGGGKQGCGEDRKQDRAADAVAAARA